MTNERSELLANVLIADQEYAKKLFAMTPADAAADLAAKGNDFTAEELAEIYVDMMKE